LQQSHNNLNTSEWHQVFNLRHQRNLLARPHKTLST